MRTIRSCMPHAGCARIDLSQEGEVGGYARRVRVGVSGVDMTSPCAIRTSLDGRRLNPHPTLSLPGRGLWGARIDLSLPERGLWDARINLVLPGRELDRAGCARIDLSQEGEVGGYARRVRVGVSGVDMTSPCAIRTSLDGRRLNPHPTLSLPGRGLWGARIDLVLPERGLWDAQVRLPDFLGFTSQNR